MADFDALRLFEALDSQRVQRGLSWRQAAQEMWDQSVQLNGRRHDHPISPATVTGMARRGMTSCQHALFMLRWLGRSPESFLAGIEVESIAALPAAGPDRRLRWDLARLYEALDTQRKAESITWRELAGQLRSTPHQLTGLRTARFAVEMGLAMRVVQWLHRPSSDFIYAAEW